MTITELKSETEQSYKFDIAKQELCIIIVVTFNRQKKRGVIRQ